MAINISKNARFLNKKIVRYTRGFKWKIETLNG